MQTTNYPDDLLSIYRDLIGTGPLRVWVAPKIRESHKESDYLYLLNRELIESDEVNLTSISQSSMWRPVYSQLRGENPIFHYHWIACRTVSDLPFFLLKWLMLVLYTATGGRLVWTIHNRMPADTGLKRLNFLIRRSIAARADRIHIQCKAAIEPVSRFYETDAGKFRYLPHPTYPRKLIPRAAAIEAINHRHGASLKVQDQIYLMFGTISRYKRIADVAQYFTDLSPRKKLVIAGPVRRGQMKVYRELKKLADRSENIILLPSFISEESVPEFMNAADCLIFNFTDEISSGGVAIGKSYKKTMLLPENPCMREIETDTMYYFKNPAELERLLGDGGDGRGV